MIISRSPLRISLGGGGTDLQSYYKDHGGFVLSAAIDKYIYTTINRPFIEGIFLKYNKLESCNALSQIEHPIIRESLKLLNLKSPQIEITTSADIPAGTGLGSSGSFTTSLLKSLYRYYKKHLTTEELASLACHIEIDILGEPIGKQDQYIAAYGGITAFDFQNDGKVLPESLKIEQETLHDLEDNLLLFFTGYSRSAGSILKDQKDKSEDNNQEMLDNLHYVKNLGLRSKECLVTGDTYTFGKLMHEHWLNKKKRSKGMSNQRIDKWYESAINNGAIGGKLVGAGGGGFLMFMAEDKKRLRKIMIEEHGLEEVRFKFDFEGTKILSS